jgi:hypothetical protein
MAVHDNYRVGFKRIGDFIREAARRGLLAETYNRHFRDKYFSGFILGVDGVPDEGEGDRVRGVTV